MAGRLAKNLKEDYLCCGICLNQYERPRTLPCDHTFCEECIKLHAAELIAKHRHNIQLTCPICRDPIPVNTRLSFDVEEWVRSLPVDTLLESLLNTVHLHESRGSQYRYSPQTNHAPLPLLCETHGGKPREAYCFTHAKLICWECAARNHRPCEVDSSENADEVVQATVNSLKELISARLNQARKMGKSDKQFSDSKAKAVSDILALERKLEYVYDSAKQQIALLRNDIERCTNLHLTTFKPFYDGVSQLLDLNHVLEVIGSGKQNTSSALIMLENVKNDLSEATVHLQAAECMNGKEHHYLKFTPDVTLNHFLDMYATIGFLDSNIPGSGMEQNTATPSDTPASISHILNRPQATITAPQSVINSAKRQQGTSTRPNQTSPARQTAQNPSSKQPPAQARQKPDQTSSTTSSTASSTSSRAQCSNAASKSGSSSSSSTVKSTTKPSNQQTTPRARPKPKLTPAARRSEEILKRI